MKKYIIESPTYGKKEVLLDDDDWPWVSKHKWQVAKSNSPAYKGPDKFYVVRATTINGKAVNFSLHREIMNTPKDFHTDHINGNTLDNRKENLRVCTPRENSLNRKSKFSCSGYRGVKYHPDKQRKYECILAKRNNTFHRTAEEAAIKWDEHKKEVYGENNQFIQLNFPDGVPEHIRDKIEKVNNSPYPKRKNSVTGYRGVSYATSAFPKPYRVGIGYNKKQIYLGNYKTAEEAARVYDKEAIRLLGSKAYP
jgi:hypothetical protein